VVVCEGKTDGGVVGLWCLQAIRSFDWITERPVGFSAVISPFGDQFLDDTAERPDFRRMSSGH